MKAFPLENVKLEEVADEGASKTKVRWLITDQMGAKNFAMRLFEIEPGGHTPLHKHP
jgi:quercetin dioxygenase-like cupin family protein